MLPSTNQTQSGSELLESSVQQRLERSRSGKVLSNLIPVTDTS